MPKSVGFALVGCGYIADSYRFCLQFHQQELQLRGVYDRDSSRLAAYAACWGDRTYASLDELLADPGVKIVVNTTDPENHAAVTRAALAAGKHVYSEKPLAMSRAEAEELRDMAAQAGLRLAAAPCNVLGEAGQTLWAALRAGKIGKPRLVYAELDDGMIHRTDYRGWNSRSGKPWPARGEFAVGCTYEHAGYILTLLCAMFGPVRRVTSFAALLIADKRAQPPLDDPAPDFSVGVLEFDGGVVARLTNSIVAPYDHRLRVIGDEGALELREPWDYACPVKLRPVSQGRLGRFFERRFGGIGGALALPMVRKPSMKRGHGLPTMDFLRGVAELANSMRENRPCRLGADFAVHIAEVTEKLQYPERFLHPAPVASCFKRFAPMEWTV